MDELELTRHGKKRIRERVGVGKSDKKINRAAKLALERGLKHSEVKGTLRRYLDRMYMQYNTGNNVRIYNSQVWVFQNSRLITVKPIPSRYQLKFQIYEKNNKEDKNKRFDYEEEV